MELLYSNTIKGPTKGIQGLQIYYLPSTNEIKISTNRGKIKKASLDTGFSPTDLYQTIYDVLEENAGLHDEIYEASIKAFDALYKLKRKENEILFTITGFENKMNKARSIIFSISNDEFEHKICVSYTSSIPSLHYIPFDTEGKELEAHLYLTREKLAEKYDIVFAIAATERIANTLLEIREKLSPEDFSYSKTISVPRKTKNSKPDILLKALDFYSKYKDKKEEKKEEKYKEYYRYQDTTINLNIDYVAEVYTDPENEGGYAFELSVGKDSTIIYLYKEREYNDEILEAIIRIFCNKLRSRGVIEIDESDFSKAKEFFFKMYKLLIV